MEGRIKQRKVRIFGFLVLMIIPSLFNNRWLGQWQQPLRNEPTSTHPLDAWVMENEDTNETMSLNPDNSDSAKEDEEGDHDHDDNEVFNNIYWNRTCRRVQHVVFLRGDGGWWYKSVPGVSVQQQQPPLRFIAHMDSHPQVGFPKEILVHHPEQSEMMMLLMSKNRYCPYSPLPNHLILSGHYNEMLGEFYDRVLSCFHYLLSQDPSNRTLLLETTQVFLHLWNLDRRVLDSQVAFTAPYLSHHLRDFRELLDSTACTCVKRLVLCGYTFEESSSNKNETIVTIAAGRGLSNVLMPQDSLEREALYREMHRFFQDEVILNNLFVQQDIDNFRRSYLESQNIQPEEGAYENWKIVGLAQRTGRRKWMNLDEALEACNKEFRQHQILCMEVNVEHANFHPTHHAVVHANLDGLIGIHGAQLTEGLWMKPGSLVVEMLPFLPKEVTWGRWTREVRSHTPLGLIFTGTELSHVCLPLTKESVPQCSDKHGPDAVTCISDHPWSDRDFPARAQDIVDVIASFFTGNGFRPESCQEQKKRAGEYRFVLYNVQCWDDDVDNDNVIANNETLPIVNDTNNNNTKEMTLHHFYWDKDLSEIPIYSIYD